ncbi:MAG TPA: 2-oxo acid dehydrogenase subunit E2 [Ignavibacteria bacterium]|nr:2-oxo acid dehydrogenase subunit E2 [Ignavibacteria bacterium]
MIKEIKLPEVSDNVETGDVLKVLVAVGDKINIDPPAIELETDKASFEVPSTESGIVKEINVKQGDIIRIGAVILKVETNGTGENESETTGDKIEEKVSDVNKKDETEEKSNVDIRKEDNTEVNKSDASKEENRVKKVLAPAEYQVEFIAGSSMAPASPSVRRLARELGIDIASVKGSDSGGRITEDDVKNHVKSLMNSRSSIETNLTQKYLPDFKKWGDIEIQDMSKVRSITADAMSYAWTTIPMVTQFDKSDITGLEEFRKIYSKKVEEEGGHLTITSLLVKVCEAALKNFPQFNSSIDLQKKEIIFKKYFNIGVAVDTDRGLLVPVIKNTDGKNLTQISKELNELAEKARNKKITPDEMEGGNFTISNLGGIGGTNFTPIVYSPQVAILGVSRGNKEAVYVKSAFEPRLILPLSLTYDHRIIDGADAARFLRWICEALENPFSMMI